MNPDSVRTSLFIKAVGAIQATILPACNCLTSATCSMMLFVQRPASSVQRPASSVQPSFALTKGMFQLLQLFLQLKPTLLGRLQCLSGLPLPFQ